MRYSSHKIVADKKNHKIKHAGSHIFINMELPEKPYSLSRSTTHLVHYVIFFNSCFVGVCFGHS